MEGDCLIEIEGLHVGRRFELAPGVTHYFVAGETGVSLQPTRPFSLVAVLEPAEGGWDLSVPAGGIRIVVKEVEEDRERDEDATGRRVRLEDAHILCIHPRAGSALPETKWLFQRPEIETPETAGDEAELYSPKTGLILTRRKTMAIRAVTARRRRFASPLEAWRLTDHPLRKDLEHVLDLVEVDPSVSLRKCRRLLKGALRARYRAAVGDPEGLRLRELLEDLGRRRLLPEKVAALGRSVLELSASGGEPILEDPEGLAREAHLALWCLTLLLEWHHRARPSS